MSNQKSIFMRILTKGTLITATLSMTLGSLAPLAANAASLTSIKDVMSRIKASTTSIHQIAMTIPTNLVTNETISVDFSSTGNGTFALDATNTWVNADIAVTVGTTDTLNADGTITLGDGTTMTQQGTLNQTSNGTLSYPSCTSYTGTGSNYVAAVTSNSSSQNPVFAVKFCGTSPTTGTKIIFTINGTSATGAGTFTNPSATGSQLVTITDTAGSTTNTGLYGIGIVSEDQAGVSSAVNPSLTFSVGVPSTLPTTSGNCATISAFTNPSTAATLTLGTLTGTTPIRASGTGSVDFICNQVSTNATSGVTVTVVSANGALKDSNKNVTIPATPYSSAGLATPAANTETYGLCATRIGRTATTGDAATITVGTGFNGSAAFTQTSGQAGTEQTNTTNCPVDGTAVGAGVGKLANVASTVWSTNAPVNAAYAELSMRAIISTTLTPVGTYTDTLTFIAFGTF